MTVEQGLFKRHFVGRDNFIWWLGQIVDETKWSGNIPGYRTPTTEDHKGFEYRYKVRIMGYHTGAPSELSDDDLPWASVMYPVTAGAGTGGLSQTPNLKQGMFVYGFYLDGEDSQQPIIMGVLGYNQYTQILNNIPDAGFIPFQGYKFNEETVARYSLRSYKETPEGTQADTPKGGVNNSINQSTVGDNSLATGADEQQKREGQKRHSIPATSICEPQPLGQIQLDILELVKDVELARKSLTDWKTKVSTKIDDVQRWIEDKIKFVSDKVSQGIEWIITKIQENTIERVNNALKDTYYLLFPNERPNLKAAVETANDLLACLFKKIMKNMYSLVSKLLVSIVDKLVNVTSCLINQFVGTLLGSILNDILSGVTSVLSTIGNIVGTAIDIAGNILGFIADIFSWLTCDTKPDCPEVDSWSPWDGVEKTASFDVQGLVNQVTNFAGGITDQIGGAVGAVEGAVSSIRGTVENAVNGFDVSPFGFPCDVGPFRCGPPVVDFYGGEGSGVNGNVIIGFTGEILGVDIITEGGGFSEPPFVKFKDNCGKGTGAVGRAILEYDPDAKGSSGGVLSNDTLIGGTSGKEGCVPVSGLKNGRVVAVVIEEPGKDYLYTYDGSEGGGGRTFANYCETMVRRAGGCYDLPYVSGEVINLNAGDWIKYPNSVAIQVTEPQTVTAPSCGDLPPPSKTIPTDSQSYSIDLTIERVVVLDPGFNYNPGDPLTVISEEEFISNPNNGFSAEVGEVDPQGGIRTILIKNEGSPFFSYPRLVVTSETGFNAKLAPKFRIARLTPEEVERKQQAGVNVIQVIDCVGKIPPKQEFQIIP